MKLRLALVDDNPMDRDLATEALDEACPDCEVELFASGQAVLTHLQTVGVLPDVILLDINMPGMNGFEVLRALKADPRLCLIPVVMLTTSGASEDIQQAYTLHASSYVVKAASFSAFLEQVESFIRYWTLNEPALV